MGSNSVTKNNDDIKNNQAIKKALLKLQAIEMELAGVKELLQQLETDKNGQI